LQIHKTAIGNLKSSICNPEVLMAKSSPDDEAFEEKPRPRSQPPRPAEPSDENFEEDDRPARRSKPPRRRDDDDDDDARPRRRSRRPRQDDTLSGLIPYKNGMALAAYYCGVFSLIPCVGGILGPLAIIFGIIGLRKVNENPEARGTGHAIAGIVLGSLALLGHLIAVIVIGTSMKR
jgi:hypothetical protein